MKKNDSPKKNPTNKIKTTKYVHKIKIKVSSKNSTKKHDINFQYNNH